MSEVEYDYIKYAKTGAVAIITLNRPARLNALTPALAKELCHALDAAAARAVRCLVITGAGGAFCSGADLGPEQSDDDATIADAIANHYRPVMTRLLELDKPTIAAINGAAAGGGAALAYACDLRIVGEAASFPEVFIRRAMVPGLGLSYFLPRLVGLGRARELTTLGERVGAYEALRLGMVTRVVADDELMREAEALARRLADGPTRSYAFTRQALLAGASNHLLEALEEELWYLERATTTADFAEAIAAFREKRRPRFRGE